MVRVVSYQWVTPATHTRTVPAFTPQPHITAPWLVLNCAYSRRDGLAELTIMLIID